ncbi:hypothetical protein TBK1r_17390 [Stieleria magnilauensis]|uniref:Uncharacterized protein n=1 Tax=Stieleria magnilauensis TaxID=2527963 RepID=A0ABX5XLE8_9BACT|nr:hypothetical protein TBK1r_17390 [Planctomycetes bacterium TBK1r]
MAQERSSQSQRDASRPVDFLLTIAILSVSPPAPRSLKTQRPPGYYSRVGWLEETGGMKKTIV